MLLCSFLTFTSRLTFDSFSIVRFFLAKSTHVFNTIKVRMDENTLLRCPLLTCCCFNDPIRTHFNTDSEICTLHVICFHLIWILPLLCKIVSENHNWWLSNKSLYTLIHNHILQFYLLWYSTFLTICWVFLKLGTVD